MNNSSNSSNSNSLSTKFDNMPDDVAIITKIWGPPIWFFLHSMSLAYPKRIDSNNVKHQEIKKSMYLFLSNLSNVLPCPLCANSYYDYINEPGFLIDNYLDSRESLFKYIYLLHEKVNDKLGVPMCKRPTIQQAFDYYSRFIANNPCKATTEEERKDKLELGCKDTDFIQYKCVVDIIENNSNNKENNSNNKENNSTNNKEKFTNSVPMHKPDLCNDNSREFLYINIIAVLILIILGLVIIPRIKLP